MNAQSGPGIVIGEDVTGTPVITYDYNDLKAAIEAAWDDGTVVYDIYIEETNGTYNLISHGSLDTLSSLRVNELTPEQQEDTTLMLFENSDANTCTVCVGCDKLLDENGKFERCDSNCDEGECNHSLKIPCEVFIELNNLEGTQGFCPQT